VNLRRARDPYNRSALTHKRALKLHLCALALGASIASGQWRETCGMRFRGIRGGRRYATVVRGVLYLPEASSRRPQITSCLLDISGRGVMELRPGVNDVRALAPGHLLRARGVWREA
jgi:hypothetical protein